MNKIWVIARREYLATVRTKAFLISLVMMPVLMGAGGVISYVTKKLEDQGERKFAVVDRTPGGKVFPILEVALERRNKEDIYDRKTGERIAPQFVLERVEPSAPDETAVKLQRLELSERVRKGELAGFLEVGPKAMDGSSSFGSILSAFNRGAARKDEGKRPDPAEDPAGTRYQSTPTLTGSMEFYRWATIEISLATRLGLASQQPEVRKAVLEQRVPVVMLGLSTGDPHHPEGITDDEGATKAIAGVVVGIGCIMLMFTVIMAVAAPMMQGVLEEKMQRISEVLLGSLTPFELMAGKLLGGVGVALTLAAVYLAGALWAVYHYGQADQISAGLVAWFVFYQTLALLMYGSMFMAVGAACTDMKEPQTLILPVLLPAMLPLFLVGSVLKEPDGLLTRLVSFFPPSTPMLMVTRQAMRANIAWWEPVLGAVLVLGFTVFCVWAAGRIFRVGILVQGKGARLGEMLSWVFRS
jgi:ABC-2 type transport system permease protein